MNYVCGVSKAWGVKGVWGGVDIPVVAFPQWRRVCGGAPPASSPSPGSSPPEPPPGL